MAISNRTVIKTHRKQRTGTELTLGKADIERLSRELRDGKWYAAERMRAWQDYQSMPMPTLQDEPWRRTDIRAMRWDKVLPEALRDKERSGGSNGSVPARLRKPLVGRKQGGQVVVSDGLLVESSLDQTAVDKGVVFTDLLSAARTYPELLAEYMGKLVPVQDGKHAAMAAALADQGVFVFVPAGVMLEQPLHSVLWSSGLAQFSRVVVVIEKGAALTFVHELSSKAMSKDQLHAGTVEVFVGDGAELTFIEMQSLGKSCWNFSHERAQVGVQGRLDWIFSSIGSKLTKSFLDLNLAGKGAWGRMSGFYFASGQQHLDHDTQQNHLAAEQTSDLLFKGALRDQCRSVWQGMINVAPGAQKADGFQANRNLLLSNEARADSIPGLEIQADDVRCTHAATIGRLEDEHVFYLMSRGMAYNEARKLIVDGFFDPIMQRIPFEGVRKRLKGTVIQKMAA